MNYFNYKDNELYAEDVSIAKIAAEVGTPFYLYSYKTMERHFNVFSQAFKDFPHLVCYSVKANSNLSVLKALAKMGSGMDIVSGGELARALKVGADPKKIVFSGVGKTKKEIEYALKSEILMINVESREELDLINATAREMHVKAPISLRINPDIDAKTHPHITTGLHENKFGLSFTKALDEYLYARKQLHLKIIGIDCHIGSQLTELKPVISAIQKVKEFIQTLEKYDLHIEYVDLGGGLGITYDEETPPHPEEYGKAILDIMKDIKATLVFEPGRVIMGNAGVLVTQVLYNKATPAKNFVIVDAAMNDLIRPSLYGAYQDIIPVVKEKDREELEVDVVGPICESGDFLGKKRTIQKMESGELLSVMSSGAYGFTMASNYNTRSRVPEVLVKDDQFHVVRERESFEDLIKNEKIIDV